jgi:DnaJ-class molecular chaperone
VTPPAAAPADDPNRCRPCRGTGRLISNKGGKPHEVECTWCEGTGRFIPEHDAQVARAAASGAAPASN